MATLSDDAGAAGANILALFSSVIIAAAPRCGAYRRGAGGVRGAGQSGAARTGGALLRRLGLGSALTTGRASFPAASSSASSIARALMNGGQVILADEPTGALDSHSGEEVMAILKQLCAQGHGDPGDPRSSGGAPG